MKSLIITAAAVAAMSTAAFAAPPHTHAKKVAAKAVPIICPVTGNKIASAKAAFNSETYKGKKYYFCCAECKPRFDKNRAQIIKNAAHGKYEKM